MRIVISFLYQIQSQFTFINTSNHLPIKRNVLMKQLHLNCLMHKLEGMCISQEEVRPGFLCCFFWPNSIYSGWGSFCCAFFFQSKYIFTFAPNSMCVILYSFHKGGSKYYTSFRPHKTWIRLWLIGKQILQCSKLCSENTFFMS